jgi:hypothetical protein
MFGEKKRRGNKEERERQKEVKGRKTGDVFGL